MMSCSDRDRDRALRLGGPQYTFCDGERDPAWVTLPNFPGNCHSTVPV
jgi:hypothetical protein